MRAAPASGCIVPWNMLSMMNQIAAALPKLPSSGAKVGPEHGGQILAQRLGAEHAEPDDAAAR